MRRFLVGLFVGLIVALAGVGVVNWASPSTCVMPGNAKTALQVLDLAEHGWLVGTTYGSSDLPLVCLYRPLIPYVLDPIAADEIHQQVQLQAPVSQQAELAAIAGDRPVATRVTVQLTALAQP